MIALVKTLGTTPAGPKIFTAIPPPLMAARSIGANQTVINSVYPKLVPLINAAAKVRALSSIYEPLRVLRVWLRVRSAMAPS
jgi:hypothetical protein